MSSYRDHRWISFNQVAGRGGKVKPGEKATMVVFWKRWQPPQTEVEPPEKAPAVIPLLRYYNVFNVEQCEGLGVPDLYRPSPLRTHERIERAELLIEQMPDPPRINLQGKSAWYRPADDLVQVPPISAFRNADAYYSTLFHEMAHATGHEKRLGRPGVTGQIQFGSRDYSREELVAELTAAFCCAKIGLDDSVIPDAASYLHGWLSVLKADSKAIVVAAAQAQRAADFICRARPTPI